MGFWVGFLGLVVGLVFVFFFPLLVLVWWHGCCVFVFFSIGSGMVVLLMVELIWVWEVIVLLMVGLSFCARGWFEVCLSLCAGS